ncbi:YchJ family protein [uncultured Arsenicicoccus sp.]|uniref:YchJ family protein n=1 Tax=uncultured Arsenicicoccus sp. TaxID=491339 RepID=UPI002595E75C|nr:YchJ family protein [uncultured Arsenicicoccus sp.]
MSGTVGCDGSAFGSGAAFGVARPRTPGECPCGSGDPYERCCRPLHLGRHTATTPEQLMRSRYSAFVVGDADYLLQTWDPATRPGELRLDSEREWLGLRVIRADGDEVEYAARSLVGGRTHELHEISRFRRLLGRWVYVDGDFPD